MCHGVEAPPVTAIVYAWRTQQFPYRTLDYYEITTGRYLFSRKLPFLVQSLAIDLAPLVRVNGVAPGVVEWDQQADAAERSRYEARIPLARAGTPDDAAGEVRWLALDAPYVSGTIVTVDGGRSLQ